MPLTNKEAKQLNDAKAQVKSLWIRACIADGIETSSMFVEFSKDNQAAVDHNQAMGEYFKMLNKIKRNVARREKNEAMRSIGLKRVVGAQGGVYYE